MAQLGMTVLVAFGLGGALVGVVALGVWLLGVVARDRGAAAEFLVGRIQDRLGDWVDSVNGSPSLDHPPHGAGAAALGDSQGDSCSTDAGGADGGCHTDGSGG